MDRAPDRSDPSVEPVDIVRDGATLRSQLRDLIAILALPALWSGRDTADIAEALVEVLSSMLRLDLAYIRVTDSSGSGPSETVRVRARPDLGGRDHEIAGRLAERMAGIDANEVLVLPDPATRKPLRATRIALELAGHTGMVVIACRRSGFPTSFERFLLRSIITEAEVALHNAALMAALHQALQREQVARADAEAASRANELLNEELERRVVERTRQLSLVNEELRSEIAERQRTEHALRESEQRFRDYAETASDWLWETGPDHSFTRVSQELTTLRIDPASRIGVTRWDFATDVDEEPEKWRMHLATLEAHQPFRDFVYRTAAADGTAVYIATSGKPVFDAGGRFLGYRGVSSDVTAAVRANQVEKALHQAHEELARVTRVTTLGELAASIAHEINQPLTAISADAHACLHWLAADRPDLDSVRAALAAIVKDGDRAADVIRRIRALLSGSPVAHEPCDLTGVIRDVLPLVGPEIGRLGIVLQTFLAPDLPQVSGDRIQLQQVLLNLLLNAVEAMREVPSRRRRLIVRSTVEDRDQGSWAVVAVEDAGIGFGEAEAPRLFEAFYTTKPGGLGMGLSISRSIIDSHRGRLWATANPEHGATFHLALPGMMSVPSPLRSEDARRTVIAQGPSGFAGGSGPRSSTWRR
jgi:PAS domain S-box-containing protein